MHHGVVTVKNSPQNTQRLLKFLKSQKIQFHLPRLTQLLKADLLRDLKFRVIQLSSSSLIKNQLSTTAEEPKPKLLTGLEKRLNHPPLKSLRRKLLTNLLMITKLVSYSMVNQAPQNSENSPLSQRLLMMWFSPMFSMLRLETPKLVPPNQELSSIRNSMKAKTNSVVISIMKKLRASLIPTNIQLSCHSTKKLPKKFLENHSQLFSYFTLKMRVDNRLYKLSKMPLQLLEVKSFSHKLSLLMVSEKDLLTILVLMKNKLQLFVLLTLLVMISENSLLKTKSLLKILFNSMKASRVETYNQFSRVKKSQNLMMNQLRLLWEKISEILF